MNILDDMEFENLKRKTVLHGVAPHLVFAGNYAFRFAQWLILMDYERQVKIPVNFTFEIKATTIEDKLLIETTLNNYLLFDIYPFK